MKRAEQNDLNELVKAMRRTDRAERVADLADGRVRRAARFPDRRKEASRNACRGRIDA